jgi:hypothetical protein
MKSTSEHSISSNEEDILKIIMLMAPLLRRNNHQATRTSIVLHRRPSQLHQGPRRAGHQKSSMSRGGVGHQAIAGEGRAPAPVPGVGRRGVSVLFDAR